MKFSLILIARLRSNLIGTQKGFFSSQYVLQTHVLCKSGTHKEKQSLLKPALGIYLDFEL